MMTSLTISPLTSVNDLSEINVSEQECINGGIFFSLSVAGGTKLVRETTLQNVFSGGNPPSLKNQVVATGGSTVVIDSTIPLPGAV